MIIHTYYRCWKRYDSPEKYEENHICSELGNDVISYLGLKIKKKDLEINNAEAKTHVYIYNIIRYNF